MEELVGRHPVKNTELYYKLNRIASLLLIALIIFITACSGAKARRTMSVQEKMERANTNYDAGRYNRAADYYLEVVFERSSRHTPQAQFRLAESYFNMSRYDEAVFEYRELIRLFPEHNKIHLAYYRIGESYFNLSLNPHYCQKETTAAIDAFESYLDRYPFADKRSQAIEYVQKAQFKLLEKKYNNGYIYYRLYDYSAAIMYFNEIIELGNRNEIDKKSRYYSALIYIERKNQNNALRMLHSLNDHYPQTTETNRIQRLISRTFE